MTADAGLGEELSGFSTPQLFKQQFDSFVGGSENGFAGVGAVVGAEEATLVAAQRTFRRQGLLLENIKGDGVQLAILECLDERLLLDERPAPHIDEARAGFEQRKGVAVDHVVAGRRERAGEHDKIGFAEALGPRRVFHRQGGIGLVKGIVGDDAHTEGKKLASGGAAYVSESREGDCFSREREARGLWPRARTHAAIDDMQLAGQTEQVAQRDIGDLLAEHAGCVFHLIAAGFGASEIHIVRADAPFHCGLKPARAPGSENFRRGGVIPDDPAIVLRDEFQQFRNGEGLREAWAENGGPAFVKFGFEQRDGADHGRAGAEDGKHAE